MVIKHQNSQFCPEVLMDSFNQTFLYKKECRWYFNLKTWHASSRCVSI